MAATIIEARKEWTPYLRTWAKYMAQNFKDALSYRSGRDRLGWIDNADFWSSFWRHRENSLGFKDSNRQRKMHLQNYVNGAGAAASMSFFETAPESALELLRECLVETNVLLDPKVLMWDESIATSSLKRMRHGQLLQIQKDRLSQCTWESAACGSIFALGRGDESVNYFSDLIGRYVIHENADSNKQLQWIGHLIANMAHCNREELLNALLKGQKLAFDSQIDIPLMMLCSGYVPNVSNPTLDAISRLGSSLAKMEPLNEEGKPRDDTIAMLISIYALNSCLDLYNALNQAGLHKGATDFVDYFDFSIPLEQSA